jgi:hypothetical protein
MIKTKKKRRREESVIERYEKTSPWARGLTNTRNQKEEEVNLSL